MSLLEEFGWDGYWSSVLAEVENATARPGRVTAQYRDRWIVQLESASSVARITSGSFPGPLPVTGDWVLAAPGPSPNDPASIVAVLPRRSAISRGAAGSGATEHLLAANIDIIWIVHALDGSPNLRRIERYLAVAWESGAIPEIVLSKADLATDLASVTSDVASVAMGVVVHVVSVQQPQTIRRLQASLEAGRTVALLGPSGAGKSTLINALARRQVTATAAVRVSDRKGRHTTTRRELFQVLGGALLLDTPGLRELRVWDLADGLLQAFPEIEQIATSCRFRDCQHDAEPGCAVLAAVKSGALDAGRLASFRKLRAEAAYAERKSDPQARASAVAKHKTAIKTLRFHPKYRREE